MCCMGFCLTASQRERWGLLCFYRPYKQQTGLPCTVVWARFLEDFVLAFPVVAARGGLTLLASNAPSLVCGVCTSCFVLASLFGDRDEFLCWGFRLAGGSSCWVAGAVLARQCAGAHLLPTPSIWSLAAALHLRSFLPGTWEREMLAFLSPSLSPLQHPAKIPARSFSVGRVAAGVCFQ